MLKSMFRSALAVVFLSLSIGAADAGPIRKILANVKERWSDRMEKWSGKPSKSVSPSCGCASCDCPACDCGQALTASKSAPACDGKSCPVPIKSKK